MRSSSALRWVGLSRCCSPRWRRPDRGAMLNDIGPELDPAGLDRIGGYVGKPLTFADWEEVDRGFATLATFFQTMTSAMAGERTAHCLRDDHGIESTTTWRSPTISCKWTEGRRPSTLAPLWGAGRQAGDDLARRAHRPAFTRNGRAHGRSGQRCRGRDGCERGSPAGLRRAQSVAAVDRLLERVLAG